MLIISALIAAVPVTEMAVLATECVLAAGGAVAIVFLRHLIGKYAKPTHASVAGDRPDSENNAVESEGLSAYNKPENISDAVNEQKTTQEKSEENVETPLVETYVCPADSEADGKEVPAKEKSSVSDGDAVTVCENDGENREQTEILPDEPVSAVITGNPADSDENGSGGTSAFPRDSSDPALAGSVSELQQYLKNLKKENPAVSLRESDDSALAAGSESGRSYSQNGGREEKTGYINPSNPAETGEGVFGGYSETDKDYLHRHIAESRKKYAAAPKTEHEKVDWDKVKQYNSAVLSVGDIDEKSEEK